MKKTLPLLIALSLSAGNAASALAWGGGDCPYSKKGASQESVTEKAEESESSKKD